MNNKEYTIVEQEHPTVASEPAATYGKGTHQQSNIHTWNEATAERHVDYSTMPGIYSDTEFEEVVRKSERSGNATNEEMRAMFAKWGAVWQF